MTGAKKKPIRKRVLKSLWWDIAKHVSNMALSIHLTTTFKALLTKMLKTGTFQDFGATDVKGEAH